MVFWMVIIKFYSLTEKFFLLIAEAYLLMLKKYLYTLWLICLTVEILLKLSLPTEAWSQSKTRSTTLPERLIFQDDFDPPGRGKPKDTSGAGSRNEVGCFQEKQPVSPLMIKENMGQGCKIGDRPL